MRQRADRSRDERLGYRRSVPADTSSTPVDTASTPVDTTNGTPVAFLVCAAQPYAAGSAWIGPNGGEIKVGKNEFKVPQGALDAPTFITMEVPSDTIRSVRFGPEGLTFKSGALPELKLDYEGCPNRTTAGRAMPRIVRRSSTSARISKSCRCSRRLTTR